MVGDSIFRGANALAMGSADEWLPDVEGTAGEAVVIACGDIAGARSEFDVTVNVQRL